MGGSYGNYQSVDNYSPPRSFGTPTTINSTDGGDTVTLTLGQLPSHIHNNRLTLDGGITNLAGTLTFVTGGGGLNNKSGGHASGGTGAVGSASRDPWLKSQLGLTVNNLQYSKIRENFRGGTTGMTLGQCNLHENRPPFYALAYIVYVGVNR
jgi:microcystin-dependent protein